MALSLNELFGGSNTRSSATSFTVHYLHKNWRVDMTAAGQSVFLPGSANVDRANHVGSFVFIIENVGSNTFTVVRGSDSATVDPGEVAVVSFTGDRYIIDVRAQTVA